MRRQQLGMYSSLLLILIPANFLQGQRLRLAHGPEPRRHLSNTSDVFSGS